MSFRRHNSFLKVYIYNTDASDISLARLCLLSIPVEHYTDEAKSIIENSINDLTQ
jgi:hypothetical protein